jgi:hypothetical protein
MRCAGCDRQLEEDEAVIEVSRTHVFCLKLCCKMAMHTREGLYVHDEDGNKITVPFGSYFHTRSWNLAAAL